MTTTTALPDFEGETVTAAKVRITNAGDGLSEALKVTPEALHRGDEVFYVLRGEVTQVNHATKDETIVRVHTVKADAITKVDGDLASKMLQEAAEELQRRKDEVDGQMRLEPSDAEKEALAKEAKD